MVEELSHDLHSLGPNDNRMPQISDQNLYREQWKERHRSASIVAVMWSLYNVSNNENMT